MGARTKPSLLLVGALGMLGRRVHEVLRDRWDVTPTARAADRMAGIFALDVTDDAAIQERILDSRPDVVVNCSGYTAVDRAESEPELAFRVNALAPKEMARATAKTGALLVHVSSDFVFDGTKREPYVETDATNPLSAYARSKEAGERFVREANPRHAIVRTQWLYGPDGKHFPGTILRLCREGKPLRVVDDQTGAPTYAPDVAAAIGRILDAGLTGTIHAANRGQATWCQFARAVLAAAGEHATVSPITTAEYPTPARRPRYSVLRNAVLEATIGDAMRPWEEALAAFMSQPARP
jgi:dTDP-4-dehydrorhamnose reductase